MLSYGMMIGQIVLPDEYVLNTQEDYEAHEELVVQCLEWLLDTPLNENRNHRNEVNGFIMIWLSGSPEISLDIKSRAMPFLEQDEELFFTFLHGMSLYKLKHKKEEDLILLHAEGLRAVAKQSLQSEDHVERTKVIKKIVKAHKKSRLIELTREFFENTK